MKTSAAVSMLFALAQDSRLELFRLLVRKGPQGLAAGDIAERLDISPTSLSFHLKSLTHAGLLRARKDGRFIYYAPDFKAMNQLIGYLTDHCCAEGAVTADCASPPHCKETCA